MKVFFIRHCYFFYHILWNVFYDNFTHTCYSCYTHGKFPISLLSIQVIAHIHGLLYGSLWLARAFWMTIRLEMSIRIWLTNLWTFKEKQWLFCYNGIVANSLQGRSRAHEFLSNSWLTSIRCSFFMTSRGDLRYSRIMTLLAVLYPENIIIRVFMSLISLYLSQNPFFIPYMEYITFSLSIYLFIDF